MAEYRLTPAAEQDLEQIWTHTNQRWGIEQANRYVDYLIDAFAELAQLPKTAPICDHIKRGYRRRVVGRHILLSYYGLRYCRYSHPS